MPVFLAENLIPFCSQIFQAVGATEPYAQCIAESLVTSNLVGVDSHGIIRIPQYLKDIEKGQLNPKAEPTIVVDKGVISVIDGKGGFGQVAASYAMKISIQKCKDHGVGIAGLRRSNHIGRLGEHLSAAVKYGFLAVGTCNGGGPNVAPYGASQRVFGTNPMACAVPVRHGWPVLVDFAVGAAAEGKVRVAKNRGDQIDPGILINNVGEPSTDPNDFYRGGAILPIGGHKGSALSLMIEMLSGILTGAGCSAFPDYDGGNGCFFLVLDPGCFRDGTDFLNDVERMQQKVKKAKPAKDFDEVLLPGESEFRNAQHRKKNGIPVDDETWNQLSGIAKWLDVSQPTPIGVPRESLDLVATI